MYFWMKYHLLPTSERARDNWKAIQFLVKYVLDAFDFGYTYTEIGVCVAWERDR